MNLPAVVYSTADKKYGLLCKTRPPVLFVMSKFQKQNLVKALFHFVHTYLHILFYLVSYTSYIDIVPNKFTNLQFSNVNCKPTKNKEFCGGFLCGVGCTAHTKQHF